VITNLINVRNKLINAVAILCPIIEQRLRSHPIAAWDEYSLRKELVACILGSQVRYEMAYDTLMCIEKSGLLANDRWTVTEDKSFESDVYNCMNQRYRFPKMRARQLAKTRDALSRRALSLLIRGCPDPRKIRQQLVLNLAGLGPKQASMFLRNVGSCYDLAILDTHVLRFLSIQGLLPKDYVAINTIRSYERMEILAVNFAQSLGVSVGYLDWAIWATMKAARELRL
jgi:N-glycosylase/DNA lyase